MSAIRFLPKIQKGQVCLNCNKPLNNEENFCPECGQKNDIQILNFRHFIHTIFSGLLSYDSRLWRTIAALMFHPGKVSKDYIKGKRAQYANPFQFYLTISIIFFLLLGMINKYDEFVKTDEQKKLFQTSKSDSQSTKVGKLVDNPTEKELQSMKLNIDSLTIGNNKSGLSAKILKYNAFYKSHSALSADAALDSMGEKHNFWNRFYYSKVGDAFKIIDDGGTTLVKKIISNLSIALFVFLPIFAIFLKLIYIRRHLNYMEHLVFVFNTQSVFFLLMILVLVLSLFTENAGSLIFTMIFLIYLYLALLNFYNQRWFKTFVKFVLLNFIYLTLSIIGISIVFLISFLIS